jgi:ketosteroid isomerase-like protein
MSYLKLISTLFIITLLISCNNQNTKTTKDVEVSKLKTVDVSIEKTTVEAVMKAYKDAIQNLTSKGTLELFTEDAIVFESGGTEGTYANYLEHHLGPELGHFNSFIFSDYTITTEVDFPYAFTTETYIYTIDLKANKEKGRPARIINKKGVATSILKKINEQWKIIKTHTSSRNIKK